MDSYKETVRGFALRRDGKPLFNATDEHAAIVVEELFRSATREVCILTGHLAPRIFARRGPSMWSSIFLSDPDHRLRLLVKEGELTKLMVNAAFEPLQSAPNVEMRALPDEIEEQIAFRFIIGDDDLYRFEPDKNKCEAVAAFGGREIATHLLTIFEELWAASYAVDRTSLKMVREFEYENAQAG